MKLGFDNDKYLRIQSEHIKERIAQFGDKLYMEFGGKLYDDYHASRVLPGFHFPLQLVDVPQDPPDLVRIHAAVAPAVGIS